MKRFNNRTHAGQVLAEQLVAHKDKLNTLILALPRGGVPVAFEMAQVLHLPMDVYIVRKLGVPGHEELAMGAIANDGTTVFNTDILDSLSLTAQQINIVIAAERCELARRNKCYRNGMPPPIIADKTIILVDDGLATGATMRTAIAAIKKSCPSKIIVAVPVGAPETCEQLTQEVDELICLLAPTPLCAVGAWYEDFSQTSDDEVVELLQRAKGLSRKR